MAIDTIRTRLQTDFAAMTGITRAFKDEPDLIPSAADCPCVMIAWQDPACEVRGDAGGSLEYNWRFSILVLVTPLGLGTTEERHSNAEEYVKKLMDTMSADTAGGGRWRDWNKDSGSQFYIGNIEYKGQNYYGVRWDFTISEQVDTTFGAGV